MNNERPCGQECSTFTVFALRGGRNDWDFSEWSL